MSTLVIAEHDNQENKAQTLVAIAAAEAIGNEIHVLVAGSGEEGHSGKRLPSRKQSTVRR